MFDVIPLTDQTWLICGGRDFNDKEMFDAAMSDLIRLRGMPSHIIHGNAAGADALANKWAVRKACSVTQYPADWSLFGLSAGPRRNQEMIDKAKPHLVVAFPGGVGTSDMIKRARDAGIDVAEIRPVKESVS